MDENNEKNKEQNINNEQNIINEILNEPVEPVEITQDKKESEIKQSEISEKEIEFTTKAIVGTIDTIQKVICNIVSNRNDIDYSLTENQKKQLYDIWLPVVEKYAGRIPVEITCIIGTGIIIGSQIINAKNNRIEKKKWE